MVEYCGIFGTTGCQKQATRPGRRTQIQRKDTDALCLQSHNVWQPAQAHTQHKAQQTPQASQPHEVPTRLPLPSPAGHQKYVATTSHTNTQCHQRTLPLQPTQHPSTRQTCTPPFRQHLFPSGAHHPQTGLNPVHINHCFCSHIRYPPIPSTTGCCSYCQPSTVAGRVYDSANCPPGPTVGPSPSTTPEWLGEEPPTRPTVRRL